MKTFQHLVMSVFCACMFACSAHAQSVADALEPVVVFEDDSAFVQRPAQVGGVTGGVVGLALGAGAGVCNAVTEMIAGHRGDYRIREAFTNPMFYVTRICNKTFAYAFGLPFSLGKTIFYDVPGEWFD